MAFYTDSISIDMCFFISANKCLRVSLKETPSKLARVLYKEFETAYNSLISNFDELSLPFEDTIEHTPLRKKDQPNIIRFDNYAHCDINLHLPKELTSSRKDRIKKEYSKMLVEIISKTNSFMFHNNI